MGQLSVTMSDEIVLRTLFGDCRANHVSVDDETGECVREGVVVRSLQPPSPDKPILVRLQSSCLFSESLQAIDCDCARQLDEALRQIVSTGGLLLYFYEEGRGAGLRRKFRAIRLQQFQHMDTDSAYRSLSLNPDMRSYEAAGLVLRNLLEPERPVALLSNNPTRTSGLREHGINVVETVPLICGSDDPVIRQYLIEKRKVLGHKIPF